MALRYTVALRADKIVDDDRYSFCSPRRHRLLCRLSAGRYLLSGWVHRLVPYATFLWGTLAVNVSGCFLIGIFSGLADSKQLWSPELRLFVMLGLLGGFTTFSSFAYETAALARDADLLRAFANVALQVVLGLFAAWFAYVLAR